MSSRNTRRQKLLWSSLIRSKPERVKIDPVLKMFQASSQIPTIELLPLGPSRFLFAPGGGAKAFHSPIRPDTGQALLHFRMHLTKANGRQYQYQTFTNVHIYFFADWALVAKQTALIWLPSKLKFLSCSVSSTITLPWMLDSPANILRLCKGLQPQLWTQYILFCEADGQLWKECQRYRVKNPMALVSFVLHLCSVRNQNSTENSAKATHPETARNGAKGERRLPGLMKGLQDVLRTTPPSRLTSHLSVRSILLPHCPTLWARLDPTSCENMDSQCHDAKKGSSSWR